MAVCYIFAALETKTLPYIPTKQDYVIAADKGLDNLKKIGIKPDIIIGDFDSLGFVPSGENIKKLPVEKDDTDVGFAVNYAFELGYKEFVIYGAIGGLLDHTVANLQLSAYISSKGGKSVFVGDNVFVTSITNDTLKISNGKGRLSVFALSDRAEGVFLSGLKYPLENAVIENTFPIGVSNEFTDKSAKITVKNGTLLIVSQSRI
ncbi:MAG: thiamine diphosphokinase [Clostridia bacterium]|nr:thiamine diphosphokinase [Clostridia bacterium]